jgi:hypothetical protein
MTNKGVEVVLNGTILTGKFRWTASINVSTNEMEAFEKTPRNTVKQVYDLVIADLTKAASLLPEENSKRATRYAALGFGSRQSIGNIGGRYTW